MQTEHKNRLQMFRRVRTFLRAQPVAPEIEPSLVVLEGIIQRLEEHAAQQEARTRHTRAGTSQARVAARQLRTDLMRPVALFARSLFAAGGDEQEAIRRSLFIPRATDYEGLVVGAEGMAQLLATHEARFVAAGLPKEHRARFTAGIDALRAAVGNRSTDRGKRSAATVGARTEAREGYLLVKIIDALVVPTLRNDAARLADWRSISAVTRLSGGGRTTPVGDVDVMPPDDVNALTPATKEVKAA